MVQDHQLCGGKSGHGVCSAVVVGELDFEYIRGQHFDDGTDLTAFQIVLLEVVGQGDNIEQMDFTVHGTASFGSANVTTGQPGNIFASADNPQGADERRSLRIIPMKV